jgi:L-malate glycosyltransferase
VCGPMSLRLLARRVPIAPELGDGYAFPFTSHLVLELVARGHEVYAVTLSDRAARAHRFGGDHDDAGGSLTVTVCPYRPSARDRGKDLFRAERRSLRAALEDVRPDVVHAWWTYEFAQAALETGRPTLVTAQDWPPLVLRMTPDRYRAMRLVQGMATIARTRQLTAPSPYLARRYRRWGRHAQVIPNAVPDGSVDPVPIRDVLDEPRLGAINNGWGQRKNVARLLEAFAGVRHDRPAAKLTLLGADYEPGGPAQRWAETHQLAEGVHFVGPLDPDGLRRVLRELDLFVHPSREETFGVVLIEAMAAGVPVLAGSRSGAVPWVLAGGEAGALVDVEDPAAIRTAVESLIADPARRTELARAGAERVRRSFTLSTVATSFELRYEQVIEAAACRTAARTGGARQDGSR